MILLAIMNPKNQNKNNIANSSFVL